MKVLSTVFIFIMCVSLMACTSGNNVNGRSIKTANRSVNMMKSRLPIEQRIEFEVSYWTLRDEIRDTDEFLETVDGKSFEEIIVLGKEVFQQRKNAGFIKYDKYTSWEQMITQFVQERLDQNKPKFDPRDQANNVLYQL